MKRRTFLRNSATAAALPVLLNGLPVTAFGRSPLLDALDAAPCQDRVLVLIQLNGGNDGLNTLVPLDQYAEYQAARANIAIEESTLLKLTNATGLHPKMTGLSQLYSNGKVRVIQAVGYAVPNYSHFRSTDIWLSASDSEEVISTGWMGRYLEGAYPGFPLGYPNASMPDPLAIQIGSVISPGLEGVASNMGMAFTDPNSYFNISNQNTPVGVGRRAGTELRYVRDIGQQIERFATPVKNAAGKAKNKSTRYPAAKTNLLADQLKIVAQLIAGGLKTRIYIVSQSGYDTHSFQVQGGAGTPVPHGTLLEQLSVAIDAFQDDIKLLGVEDRVVGLTFSEFGRRIKSNSSGGTDHGAAAPVFLFGSSVKSGILGQNPTIPTTVSVDDNLPMQFDFRSVYATLLRDWFCVDQATVNSLLNRDFGHLDLFDGISTTSVMDHLADTGSALFIAPNPAHALVSIGFSAPEGRVSIALFDATGRQIATAGELMHNGIASSMSIDVSALASGNYYVRLEHATGAIVKPLIVQR
ncbi:MAG: DUF1501 domain-containing protein [Candidatus Kapabacteria bacterium]|nr:DUF1501 domain-containing protein [Candidatus Kapabacteria bacterium]